MTAKDYLKQNKLVDFQLNLVTLPSQKITASQAMEDYLEEFIKYWNKERADFEELISEDFLLKTI